MRVSHAETFRWHAGRWIERDGIEQIFQRVYGHPFGLIDPGICEQNKPMFFEIRRIVRCFFVHWVIILLIHSFTNQKKKKKKKKKRESIENLKRAERRAKEIKSIWNMQIVSDTTYVRILPQNTDKAKHNNVNLVATYCICYFAHTNKHKHTFVIDKFRILVNWKWFMIWHTLIRISY